MKHPVRQIVLVSAAVSATALSAFGSVSSQSNAPIKLGAIGTLTSPIALYGPTQAARAVFDRLNAQGGIQGRRIEYSVEDDRFDPATTAQVARKLIDETGVLALVGGGSLLECEVNANFYKQKDILVMPGIAASPGCFNSPNIAPLNPGGLNSVTLGLYFISETLKAQKVCAIVPNVPGLTGAFNSAMDLWAKTTNKTLAFRDDTFDGQKDDITPFVLRAKQAGCNGLFFAGAEPNVIALVRAVRTQNVRGMAIVVPGSGYSDSVAKALGAAGNGVYALSEFEPYTTEFKALRDWRSLMTESKVTITSNTIGGYLSANIFVGVLKGIKGEINKDSINAALRSMKPVKSPLIGSPFVFGPGERHAPNISAKVVQLRDGQWVPITSNFIKLP
jgi:branched-chain amino acid transport system substrate-binding protein